MKSLKLVALMGMLFFFFTACQKEEISENSPIDFRKPPECITNDPTWTNDTPCPGDDLNVTVCFPATCGSAHIQYEQSPGVWVQIGAENPLTGGCLTGTLQDVAAGTYEFRVQYVSSGGGCDFCAVHYEGANEHPNSHFSVTVEPCCLIEAGDYFTYSHGFYMSSPNGEAFLDAHPELGPVDVGCAAGTTTSYSLDDIIAMDPGNSSPPGILVKQIITMTLNVSASSFLGSGEDLGCLVVVADDDELTTLDDLFEGMTVNEILEEANNLVGGCGSSFSEGDLTEVLAAIVANFHEGANNNGLLTCCE